MKTILKPSALTVLAKGLAKQGIDISALLKFAEYLNDEAAVSLLQTADFSEIEEGLLERLMPFLDEKAKMTIFMRVLEGEMDWRALAILAPYYPYMSSQMEAAVVEGALPWEALKSISKGMKKYYEKIQSEGL